MAEGLLAQWELVEKRLQEGGGRGPPRPQRTSVPSDSLEGLPCFPDCLNVCALGSHSPEARAVLPSSAPPQRGFGAGTLIVSWNFSPTRAELLVRTWSS